AHEIRNPLTSMNMWLYQLRQTAEHSPASAHACDVLESELGRLMQLTNSFLQLSRSPELKLAAVDPGAVIDSTLELSRHRLEQKHLRLRRENPASRPRVHADAEQLKQVLLNLITNAVE